jgi:signal transduction histidine kinase
VVVLAIALLLASGLAIRWANRERLAAEPALISGQPGFKAETWVDSRGDGTFQDALRASAAFVPMRPPRPGKLDPCVWYRLTVDGPDADRPSSAILGVSHEFLQSGDLYTPVPGGGATVQHTGSVVRWQDRAVPGNHPAFNLTLLPRQPNVFYLRIADTLKQPQHFSLWTDPAAFAHLGRLVSTQCIGYFSLWIGLIAYNGFLYAVLRRSDYQRYLIYLLTVGALAFAASDLSTFFLPWPHWPLRGILLTILVNLTTFTLLRFSTVFLETGERWPRLDRVLTRVGFGVLALSLLTPAWLSARTAEPFEALDFAVNIVVLAGLPIVGIWLGLRRTPQAWLYVLAFLPTVLGFIYSLQDNVGLPEARTNGMPWVCSSALELVFLALALAWRYRRITDEALQVTLEYTARLEDNVALRTRELREANELLARANRDKDRVLAIIGHDLRGPATMLHTLADSLADEDNPLPPEDSASLARSIKEACESQLVLLDNLVEWGRVQAGQSRTPAEPLAVAEMVFLATGTLTHLARTKGVSLTSDIPAGLTVHAAPEGAQTIMRNLVGNALKFTPTGGSIIVSAQPVNRMVEIAVRDTGIGMSSHRLAELMAGPVTSSAGTQSEKGAGIGLTLCRDLARASGGELIIHSELGRGTTVRLSLPQKN